MENVAASTAPELRRQANLYRRLAAVGSREIARALRRLADEFERRAERLDRGGR
jgi:hypothetical protein